MDSSKNQPYVNTVGQRINLISTSSQQIREKLPLEVVVLVSTTMFFIYQVFAIVFLWRFSPSRWIEITRHNTQCQYKKIFQTKVSIKIFTTKSQMLQANLINLVGQPGIEPGTFRLRADCSAS
jgi:hypothetical protein